MSRRSIAVFAVVLVLGISGTTLWSLGGERHAEAVGPSAPNQMAVDADPGTPGVQSTRTIVGPGTFTIGIDITQIGEPYHLYTWDLGYPTDGLSFTGQAIEHSEATGLPFCTAPGFYPGMTGEVLLIGGACIGSLPPDTSVFVGEVTTLTMRCLADGTYLLRLLDRAADPGNGSSLVGPNGGPYLDTGTTSASLTCSNVGVVPTSTNTPIAPTPTPRPDGPNVMALDAATGQPGVQSSTVVAGGGQFSVGVDVTSLGAAPYGAYQWLVELPVMGLAFDGAVEDYASTGLKICANTTSLPSGPGMILWYGGCAGGSIHPSVFIGEITVLRLHCLAEGSFRLSMLSLKDDADFGSTLMASYGAYLETTTTGVTINCETPSTTATATTAAATHTPAATRTRAATRTAIATRTATATSTPRAVKCSALHRWWNWIRRGHGLYGRSGRCPPADQRR